MAVHIRKLPPEEVQRAFPRRGQQDLSDYVAAVRELQAGEAAAIERHGLSDRAIKRWLGMAAKQLGYGLKWSRQSSPEVMYFRSAGHLRLRRPTAVDTAGLGRRRLRRRRNQRLN
jgi:hypothetical protein